MTREEAIDLLETVVKGMGGKIAEAIQIGLKDMKSMMEQEDIKSEDCSGGACPIQLDDQQKETLEVLYHTDIDEIRQVEGSDWIDLRAAEDVALRPGDYRRISLGVSIKLPKGHEAHIAPRSSSYEKYGIQMVGSGVIDESYCGDSDVWHFAVKADRTAIIKKNERICQFRIEKKQPDLTIKRVDSIGNRNRGGFGSTGSV